VPFAQQKHITTPEHHQKTIIDIDQTTAESLVFLSAYSRQDFFSVHDPINESERHFHSLKTA
jgi:hypothetical protein